MGILESFSKLLSVLITRFTLILGLVILLSLECLSQNLYFIGDKSFPATDFFGLPTKGKNDDGNFRFPELEVGFGKDGEGGIIILSRDAPFESRIAGEIVLYLDDGTIIRCIDRNIKDYVNSVASSVYFLTPNEIEKLMETNINSIRYSLVQLGKKEARAVENVDQKNLFTKTIQKRVNFPEELTNLFK